MNISQITILRCNYLHNILIDRRYYEIRDRKILSAAHDYDEQIYL